MSDLFVEVELVGAGAWARLQHRQHVVIPARTTLGPGPVGGPAIVCGIDIGGQPLLEAVQLVRPAEMHLARKRRAVAGAPEVMSKGRNVAGEVRSVVERSDARRQRPGQHGVARGRAERAVAIGRLEHHAAIGQPLEMGCLDHGMPVEREEARRHLVGHQKEDIGRSDCHRPAPVVPAAGPDLRELLETAAAYMLVFPGTL